ncbi:hypothetical protein G7Y89_g11054 [Cudoniella acicularis]|uniref:DUF7907 domain-containing protein n=1 Tax=Cudoniella acicularis TaxID=354080 RepID=A0A8H4VYM3_9HELO|nr:hypothetical protein G7Y89_g11054 [Cudoniella acicularis]
MRQSIIASILAFAASQVTAQTTVQSAPFYLVLASDNTTINGVAIYPCHYGAAQEGMCIGSTVAAGQYQFNTTTASATSGILTWVLDNGQQQYSLAMGLESTNWNGQESNVVVPLFQPDSVGATVDFDSDGMTVETYQTYVCETEVLGFLTQTLGLTSAGVTPNNPTCISTAVNRVFV